MVLCVFLVSCKGKNSDEVYFIHAVGFDGHEDGIDMSVVLESSQKKGQENEYFTVSFSGSDTKEALSKMLSEYDFCYFSTAKSYYIGETLSRRALFEIAKDIPCSPFFPSQSTVVSVIGVKAKELLDNIRKSEDLKKVHKLVSENKVNAVEFFALCTSVDRSVKTMSLSYDGEFKKEKGVYYRNCARAEYAYYGDWE